jgi:folylpolyglutamate synthase/dihydropteroate synthase
MLDRSQKSVLGKGKVQQRTYAEVVEFLNKNWWAKEPTVATFKAAQALNKAVGNPASKVNSIAIAGTNGKSLTAHYATKLMQEEGLQVGTLYAPHILTYNERFVLNGTQINNKLFTELANEVLNAAVSEKLEVGSYEVLTVMAALYFAQSKVDVALMEASSNNGYDAIGICRPKVVAVTRITEFGDEVDGPQAKAAIDALMPLVDANSWVATADQNKNNTQHLQLSIVAKQANWAMPIRKLAPLNYPFEQLHGRCAALAERICQLFAQSVLIDKIDSSKSLLIKEKGQRGRPSLKAKLRAQLNPRKTMAQFWKETSHSLPCRFNVLEKEKPTVLLDNASNVDALQNLLLGIRLLHYQRPLKGLCIIMGAQSDSFRNEEFLRQARYFFKKTSGELLLCPVGNGVAGTHEQSSWDVEKVINDVKAMKIKSRGFKSFAQAFEYAKSAVDEKHGLVVVAGSNSVINEYWKTKNVKKLS